MYLFGVAMWTGCRRETFLVKVEAGAKEAATRHPPLSTMADSKWEDSPESRGRVLRPAQKRTYGWVQGGRHRQGNDAQTRAKSRARLVELCKGKEECDEERRKAEAEQDAIAWRLKELTRRAQGIRRRWEKMKRATLGEELQEAVRSGRKAKAHKISRLLSGKSGPKNRLHRSVKRPQTVQEWRSELGEPGPCRGAVPCCFAEELNNWKQSATWQEKEELDANATSKAKDLICSLIKRFTQRDKRRVAPPWSVPNEVWIQALQLEKQQR